MVKQHLFPLTAKQAAIQVMEFLGAGWKYKTRDKVFTASLSTNVFS
jgi:hypothetical protein